MAARPNRNRPPRKPAWPYGHIVHLGADLSRNQWIKRIRGRVCSFGVLGDPRAALDKWLRDGPALLEGRDPEADRGEGLTVHEVVALWLQSRQAALARGSTTAATMRCYVDTAARLVEYFPRSRRLAAVRPSDWEGLLGAVPFGVTRRGNFVVWVRGVFKWAHESEVIDAPPRYGPAFKGATAKDRRELRHRGGARLFTSAQVRALLDAAPLQLRAMILLGIQGGFGNHDCARLHRSAVQLGADGGVIDYPRPKSAIDRVVPLWPETRAALADVAQVRPAPRRAQDGGLVFLTRTGRPWVHGATDAVGQQFRRLVVDLGLANGHQGDGQGMGFYWLRHTFRTVAVGSADDHAICRVMGHAIRGMAGVYVERVPVSELRRVVDHVRGWLFNG